MFGSRIFHTEFDQKKEREKKEKEKKDYREESLQRRKAYSLLGVAASDPWGAKSDFSFPKAEQRTEGFSGLILQRTVIMLLD